MYTLIHRANTVIENGPNVTDNTTLRDRCVVEAKFLRAWAYFELVSHVGSVFQFILPLLRRQILISPGLKEDDVYALIIADLEAAAAGLPANQAIDKGRATNAAANAFLGRVLMQKGDYAAAKTALLEIPTTGADGYGLTDRYLDNFEAERRI